MLPKKPSLQAFVVPQSVVDSVTAADGSNGLQVQKVLISKISFTSLYRVELPLGSKCSTLSSGVFSTL